MRDFRRLLLYLRPYLGSMVLAAGLLGVGGALMAAVVSAAEPLVDRVLLPSVGWTDGGGGAPTVELPRPLSGWIDRRPYLTVPAIIVAIFLVRGAVLYLGQYLTVRTGALVIRDLRLALYGSVIGQSLVFFRAHTSGLILSRILGDVQRLHRIVTSQLADLVRVGTMVPFLLATALYHEWRLSLVMLVALPLLGWPMLRLGRRLRRAAAASQEQMAFVADRVAESVAGIEVVQSFGMEAHEIDRFRRTLAQLVRAELRAGRAQALAPSIMEWLGAVVGAGLFAAAGQAIHRGALDAGRFTVVLFSLGLLFTSIRRLNTVYAEAQRAVAAAARVFELVEQRPRIVDAAGARALPPFSASVEFRHVSFDYGDGRVLDRIDLTIARGTTLALVGPSGSGKSTLARLLLRFDDPVSGAIEIDGHDLRRVTLKSLRDQIGLVTHDSMLFGDSVRDNIAYGRDDVPLEAVIAAARAADAHDFIARLPRGYDTPLGERGARLSSGQRQRIAIARALVKDPPLLILDEATSALDPRSEAAVRRALRRLMRGRTCLIIAHREATVRAADRIVVLDGGRIVEQGEHDGLLARGGLYARLYRVGFDGPAA
ncbi:MAG TPA: ABC transporter ATP-binding protein [Candidatus Polarisedimenticolaceae bacterium]|nr:ABC transporter ATP-binding protein [Candidatus Polarisedimenticolaceae bacterium]